MGRPGRVCRNDDGQWVSTAQASYGGRRVVQREEPAFRFVVSWILKLKLIRDNKRSMIKSILIGGRRVHGKALTSGF